MDNLRCNPHSDGVLFILWNRMSSRKYLHLASTRRFKEILSGGFESNKTGMCDLACTIICPVLSFCYYFQMWNSHSSVILQVKLGQEKNNGLPQLQGATIRAATRLARQASIQNGMCSWGAVEMSPCGWRGASWSGGIPAGLGDVRSQPFSVSRWIALAKRAQCLALKFWDATVYRWYHLLLFQDVNPLGQSLCHLYVLMLECWSLHDAEHGAVVKHVASKLQVFSALIFTILPTKRALFTKTWIFLLLPARYYNWGAGSFKCVLVSSYKTKLGQHRIIFVKGFMLALWHRRVGSQCLVLTSGRWGCGLQQSHC